MTISEGRKQLPSLIKRVEGTHDEVHLGAYGRDMVTLISSSALRVLKELAALAFAPAAVQAAQGSAWSGLQRRLAEGRLVSSGTFARGGNAGAGIDDHETRTWAEMVSAGSAPETEQPAFRRALR